jgi:hypothetical protein
MINFGDELDIIMDARDFLSFHHDDDFYDKIVSCQIEGVTNTMYLDCAIIVYQFSIVHKMAFERLEQLAEDATGRVFFERLESHSGELLESTNRVLMKVSKMDLPFQWDDPTVTCERAMVSTPIKVKYENGRVEVPLPHYYLIDR